MAGWLADPMRRRMLLLASPVVALGVAMAGFYVWHGPSVKTVPVRLGTITFIVSGNGKVAALEQVDVSAKVTGLVTELTAKEGDQVSVGQVLARLDDQELQARVRAQLRRSTAANTETPQIKGGDFLIDMPQHRVVVRGQETHLTPKQFDLLVYMAQHPGQVLTHRALLHAVWGTNADQPEYLRVTIGQLRKKIELSDDPEG